MIQAIVFDMDGVVVQSEKLKAQAYAIAVQRLRRLPEPNSRAISLGVAKINTDSDLRLGTMGRSRPVLITRPDIFNLYELMSEAEEAISSSVETRIRLFGSEDKGG
jgi:beta-phosphoglucomutase-like phosphatase (HAD superfamily)